MRKSIGAAVPPMDFLIKGHLTLKGKEGRCDGITGKAKQSNRTRNGYAA